MEKRGVGISFREPVDSGLNFLEFLLKLEKTVIFNSEVMLQLEEGAMLVMVRLLNTI